MRAPRAAVDARSSDYDARGGCSGPLGLHPLGYALHAGPARGLLAMSWLKAAVSGIFSGLAQWFLGLFGMSDAERLGRAETKEATEEKLLQEMKKADEIDTINDRLWR